MTTLRDICTAFAPEYLQQFEKLIDATPDGRKRTSEARERMKKFREQIAKATAQA